MLETQVEARKNELLAPLTDTTKQFEQEFMKGEANAMLSVTYLAESLIDIFEDTLAAMREQEQQENSDGPDDTE